MARHHVLALVGCMALATAACTRGAGLPNEPSLDPAMTAIEANSFVDSLTRSLAQAAIGCQNRLPIRGLGTSQINLSCGATRTCNAGGCQPLKLRLRPRGIGLLRGCGGASGNSSGEEK